MKEQLKMMENFSNGMLANAQNSSLPVKIPQPSYDRSSVVLFVGMSVNLPVTLYVGLPVGLSMVLSVVLSVILSVGLFGMAPSTAPSWIRFL